MAQRIVRLSALSIVLTAPFGPACAGSGYDIRTQSTSVLGSAQAGMTAGPYDLSRMSLNPAALGLGSGSEVLLGATGITTSLTARDVSGSTVLGTPIGGNDGGQAGTSAVLPNLYAAASAAPWLRFGLGITSYYGLGPKWDADWIGRYNVISARLRAIEVIPAASIQPIPHVILAGGPIFENLAIRTTTAIDYGTLDALAFGGAFGGTPAGSDGTLSTHAENWAVGFLLGATWEPWDGGRVGASFRSQIRHHFDGTASFSAFDATGRAIGAITGAAGSQSFTASVNNPAVFTVGVSQRVGPKLELFADAQRSYWHSLGALSLDFANPALSSQTTELNLRDTWYVAAGGRYQINDTYAVRMGAAYDSPSTSQPDRTPLLPDANTYWLAIGLEVRPTERLRLDWAYGHVFWSGAAVDLNAAQPGSTLRGGLKAITQTGGDFMSVQASYRF